MVRILTRINNGNILFTEGVKAKVYFKASEIERNSQRYLQLEDLKMDFSVKDIQMGIKNVHNGNAVLGNFLLYYNNTHRKPRKVIFLNCNSSINLPCG